ncbi:MAG: Gfo/Idh/MocA family oxidoreductase [Saprospiraceae bacterium]
MTYIDRRKFIKSTSFGALSLGLPSFIKKSAPSDTVRVAHIGLGGMGNNHMKWFQALPGVEIVGLCDVDEVHLSDTQKALLALQPDNKAILYNDFRRILDRKDVDVITCATPDFWHAQIAILAFQAGKDVYGEKPLSFNIREGQKMLKALNRYDRIFQLGTQIHAGENYHRVAEIIQSGILGKISKVHIWKTGEPPIFDPAPNQQVPAHFNYDYWLGPSPFEPYALEHTHLNYRYFMNYSGGIYQDFWCHIADIVWWSVKPKGLKTIQARGERSTGAGDTPKSLEVDFEFEDLELHWSSTPPDVHGAKDMHIGAYFIGEKGNLLCNYNTKEIEINGQFMHDLTEVPSTIIRSPGHQQNFIDSVKSRKQPQSNLAYVREMTLPMHLGLISWRLKRKLNWNSDKEKVIGDKEANSFLKRKYRKEYDWI